MTDTSLQTMAAETMLMRAMVQHPLWSDRDTRGAWWRWATNVQARFDRSRDPSRLALGSPRIVQDAAEDSAATASDECTEHGERWAATMLALKACALNWETTATKATVYGREFKPVPNPYNDDPFRR